MKLVFSSVAVLLLTLAPFCDTNTADKTPPTIEIPAGPFTITYIANEGVLISSGSKQVLIDGLHREYKPDYAFPHPALAQALELVRSPYDQIDLVLVSHIHLDHFHPESVGLHLQNNPTAVLASSDQIVDAVQKDFKEFSKVEARIKRLKYEWKSQATFETAGIKVKALGLRHGGAHFSWIQNLGHVVEIEGKKFLHLGDADMTEENFASFELAKEGIDVGFIPYWYLLSARGCTFVQSQFKPKQIIAVHISPAEAESVPTQLKSTCPQAMSFTKMLETRKF